MEQNQQININPFIQNEMGRLNYENILLKARLDYATKMNQELLQKVQELEEKLIDSKEANDTAEPKN
ncbi:hypothetical protein ACXEO8_08055 [Cytobacillus firmus]|uniref:hypothetical protein n=1 Tax=Cytobacillus firmus TaxID=1399 RepID=UPI0021C85BED|nr:hypothetical protein [Cytobacillus firmus]MCU1804749.1 hypothetical protein [Cytobacillus firmus]